MSAYIGTLLAALTVLWFLIYWIFGGVVFSVISLVRPGKMKRVRFSCLYTILSGLTGYSAAYLGVIWAEEAGGTDLVNASIGDALAVIGGAGFMGILLGLIAGFFASFVGGWVIMLVSRSKEYSWYDRINDVDIED